MANELTREHLQRLARLGARARIAELDAERAAIMKAFPELAAPSGRSADAAKAGGAAEGPAAGKKARRRRRKLSAAQRKAQSERMKRYWAERKKAQA